MKAAHYWLTEADPPDAAKALERLNKASVTAVAEHSRETGVSQIKRAIEVLTELGLEEGVDAIDKARREFSGPTGEVTLAKPQPIRQAAMKEAIVDRRDRWLEGN